MSVSYVHFGYSLGRFNSDFVINLKMEKQTLLLFAEIIYLWNWRSLVIEAPKV